MNKQESNKQALKPKKSKLLLIAFLFVYVFVNIVFFLFGEFLFSLPLLLRTFVLASLFVPIFGTAIPALQKKFYKWTIK
ncbi:hypothetical protein [Sphingobacterium faecium]|uniref:hypothetical protein n=1 Tax=Sphingobacterium faecium TaxID=34087 RepID=UPI002468E693|nr:hypothetical protein [Sphingobacterium faecium]MDH5828778.1 hypothetical protein [Sphingobacterium faecium]